MAAQCRNPPATGLPRANMYSLSARAPNTSSSSSTSMSFRYYQPPKSKRVETDSEEESSEEEKTRSNRRSSSSSTQTKRGACTHCKGLKVKCHFVPGQASCQRCTSNKLQCVVVGRKKRRAVATHEELLFKSHKQDLEIAKLLLQFDELTMENRIRSWVDKAASKNNSQAANSPRSQHSMPSSGSSNFGRDHTSWTSSYGYAESESPCSPTVKMSGNYMPSSTSHLPSPPVETFSAQELLAYFPDSSVTMYTKPPEIVARGIIHPHDVHDLFIIYFKFINPYFPVLDPVLHTPERLFWHSHFLFTLICCISTKYSTKYAPMVPVFVEFARDLAGKTLVGGRKTIDECQAFLIQSAYQLPRKRLEDQRTWLTMGLAFTLALELRLNEPLKDDELDDLDSKSIGNWERELCLRRRMNRTRTWLACYCVDATYATQFGKPAMLDVDDYTVRTCRDWHLLPYSLTSDVHLVSQAEGCWVMRHFRAEVEAIELKEKEHPSNEARISEILQLVEVYHAELVRLNVEWNSRLSVHPRHGDYMFSYLADTTRMMNSFYRLVVLFYGLQRVVSAKRHEKGAGATRDDNLVRQCIETAKEVIKHMICNLFPTGMLRYSLDAHFLFVTFAAGLLLSLLRPEMSILLRPMDVTEIDDLVRRLVMVLKSKEVAEDEHGHHAPFHYARYLTKQLKTFSALLPRHNHNDESMLPGRNGEVSFAFPHRSDMASPSNHPAWSGSMTATIFSGNAHAPGGVGDGQRAFFQVDSHGVDRTFRSEQALELSEYPVDFSLINFMNTVNEPQYTKTTPPPGSAEGSQWWQQMYPVSDQPSWPMALASHSTATYQRRSFSPPGS